MPDGSVADGLNMKDHAYDGRKNASGTLVNGIGKLYDGIVGEDNFEKHPEKWIGWRKDLQGKCVTGSFFVITGNVEVSEKKAITYSNVITLLQ